LRKLRHIIKSIDFSIITAIVLTYNEELHIERCIRSIQSAKDSKVRIVVVDSGSTDATVDIALSLGCEVIHRDFTTQAEQFQWALDAIPFNTGWILRLDADEYFPNDNFEKVIASLDFTSASAIKGYALPRYHVFAGKKILHGGRYPLYMNRIWRLGSAKIEQRLMDEHILIDGEVKKLAIPFADENLGGVKHFVDKHNKYADREAVQRIINEHFERHDTETSTRRSLAMRLRSAAGKVYVRLPMPIGPMAYFAIRYFLLCGFLDGIRGSTYHFLQGFWYRYLVEIRLQEIRAKLQNTPQNKILAALSAEVGFDVSIYASKE